jgi:hypothetical protein
MTHVLSPDLGLGTVTWCTTRREPLSPPGETPSPEFHKHRTRGGHRPNGRSHLELFQIQFCRLLGRRDPPGQLAFTGLFLEHDILPRYHVIGRPWDALLPLSDWPRSISVAFFSGTSRTGYKFWNAKAHWPRVLRCDFAPPGQRGSFTALRLLAFGTDLANGQRN